MKKRSLVALVGVVALLVAFASTALAGDTTEARTTATQSEYYVVVFTDPPAASYAGGVGELKRTKPERGQKLNPHSEEVKAYRAHLKGVHDDYRKWMASKTAKAEVVGELFLVGNALAVKLNGTRPETLSQGPGVSKVTASWLYRPAMNVSTGLISADAVWPALGGQSQAGSGIKVGIIDSGIDESHPFFACKDAIPHKAYASGVAFDPSNVLVNDHGTHVAGTVAGCVTTAPVVGGISGVAPGAELYDYNVFPGFGAGWVAFGGSAFSHDIAHALEDAVADGMDVVNMSLGGSVQGPHDLLAEVTNAVADAGVVPAVAAGNSGPGDSTVESPGSAAGALTAGATTNAHVIGIFADITGADETTKSYLAASGDFDPFAATRAAGESLVDWAETGGHVEACEAAPNAAPVQGKIALISRGSCTFTTKVRNAQNAGAFGVIVYNNVAGPPTGMAHDGTDPFPTIPAVMISRSDGAEVLANLPATAVIDGRVLEEVAAEADVLAGFSSRGPTPFTYLVKPDLTAPGVNVFSSVFNGGWAPFQGTSMATPHLAGAAALLLDANGDLSPEDVKSALVNNADRPATIAGLSPLARGGGRANVAAAAATPVTLAPASVSFGLWNGNKAVDTSVAVTVTGIAGASSCGVSTTGDGAVSASPSSVDVAAGGTATVTVTLSGGKADKLASGDYDGDVVLSCGSATLKAPWWVRIDRKAKP